MVKKVLLVLESATGLFARDSNGKSDPYIKFTWRNTKYKTEVKRKTLDPKWSESFVLQFDESTDPPVLSLEIWDWDRFGSGKPMGKVDIDLSLLQAGRESDGWYPVQKFQNVGCGKVRIMLSYTESSSGQATSGGQRIVCNTPPTQIQHQQSFPLPRQDAPYPVYPPPAYGPQPSYPQAPYPTQAPYQAPYPGQGSHPGQPPGWQAPYPGQGGYGGGYPARQGGYPGQQQGYPGQQGGPPSYQQQPPYQQPPPVLNDPVQEIKAILPQETEENIREALRKYNNNKEDALNHLLNSQITSATVAATQSGFLQQQQQQQHQQYNQQIIQLPEAHAPPQQYTAGAYGGFVHQAPPPVSWTIGPQQWGLQQAPNVVTDPNQIYSGLGRKKALLIGINYFGQASELKGCISDVKRMKAVLCGIYGFLDIPEAIVCLTDDSRDWRFMPTRQNIIYAMKWLVADARPGDIFFFHFSGHGSQTRNLTGTEEDGLDETILPVDFKKSGHVIDDEIHALIVQPLPNGARLTALMDCCHSGTGMDLPFVWNSRQSNWEEDFCPFFSQGDVQLFSGCSDDEKSADVQQHGFGSAGGAMTTAFISAITANPFGHSYPSLLEHIHRALLNRGLYSQKPQLSSTQRFPINRPFNLTDITPNHNVALGRQMRRVRPQKRKGKTSDMIIPAVGGALLGGLLLGALFDS